MNTFVYADNAATTKLSKTALDAMMPYMTEQYGNPSSVYSFAKSSKQAIDLARQRIAACLGADPREIYFTSGGTESDNWAIRGATERLSSKGRHIITSKIEHHAVMHTLQRLEKQGFEVTWLDVDEFGVVTPESVEHAIRPDTILITIMAANNEIGTILPVSGIGKVAREKKVLFHTDAVQAAGHISVNVEEWNVDMLSLSAHKFHGPKGVGLLYMKKGVNLPPLIDGGGHEFGKRSGTENVAGIAGMSAALLEACEKLDSNAERLRALRERLTQGILKIPHTMITGHMENRLPGLASFVIKYIEGESMVLRLDLAGICSSSGSACSSGSLDPSHVLLAIGLPHEIAHGSLRLSLSEYTTEAEIDYILERLPPIVERLREMSPLWDRVK